MSSPTSASAFLHFASLFAPPKQALAAKRALVDALLTAPSGKHWAEEQLRQLEVQAEQEGFAGFLPRVDPRFARYRERAWARAFQAHQQTQCVVGVLQEHNIPCAVLKGIACAAYWPAPAARVQSDIDVLVSPADFPRAKAALIASQHFQRVTVEGKYDHNALLQPAKRGRLWLELHYDLSSNLVLNLDVEAMLARRAFVRPFDALIPTLAAEDAIAYLALHAANHGLARLSWLYDIACLAPHVESWTLAAARAREWNAEAAVEVAWHYSRLLFDAAIPRALRPLPLAHRLLAAAWNSSGRVHQWAERAFRLSLAPTTTFPKMIVRKALARREERHGTRWRAPDDEEKPPGLPVSPSR